MFEIERHKVASYPFEATVTMVGRHVTLDLFREIPSRLYQAEAEEARTIL